MRTALRDGLGRRVLSSRGKRQANRMGDSSRKHGGCAQNAEPLTPTLGFATLRTQLNASYFHQRVRPRPAAHAASKAATSVA